MSSVIDPAVARLGASSRAVLLDAARDLMIERGSTDVSLHAIARRAGLTAPLVKYHFGSKEGLLTALVEADTARSIGQLDDLVALDVAPTQKLRLHVTGIIRTYARHPYLNGLLNRLVRDSGHEASARIKANFVTPLIDAQRRIIEAGVAAGEFRAVDPDHAYFMIVGTCQYLFATRVPFRDMMGGAPAQDTFVRSYAAAAVDFILAGLAAKPR
ncbi:TetR family transcriptional regulator [Sphingomonas sp. NBWT7]|uniref:TetR family transcriptional regulator n=1 Tax=Sphingomonas sp. NBWT7 TaxID=2596913 RepID=UPI00162A51CD|nr:TetR family transcriptional regulator [Sphingomonas sp. NBWT7]QNE32131.1 TetR family transcriptional regulator [Sphingomonas sp. NBWT7]